MRIEGISFIVSYACNLRCEHCFFDTRTSTAQLRPADVDAVLSDGERQYGWLHFTGGEPLLDPRALYALIRAARHRHTGDIGIATNGFWGRDRGEARTIAASLARLGVNGIGISMDPFHGGVPVEAVRNSALAVAEAGLSAHSYLMACVVPGREEECLAAAEQLSGTTGIPVARVPVRKLGRSADPGGEADRALPSGPCRELATCLGESGPFDPRMVWVDPYGNVMVCYGLAVGSLSARPFRAIMDSYDPAGDPILDRLSRHGPRGLYELAVERGVGPGEHGYADECELCFASREALRRLFPDTLTPEECYPGREAPTAHAQPGDRDSWASIVRKTRS